jgi:hypothetical protein
VPRTRRECGSSSIQEPDNVFVAAMGGLYSRNTDRGGYRSQDRGQTCTQMLFVSELAGAVELAIDPVDGRHR